MSDDTHLDASTDRIDHQTYRRLERAGAFDGVEVTPVQDSYPTDREALVAVGKALRQMDMLAWSRWVQHGLYDADDPELDEAARLLQQLRHGDLPGAA